jgi:hypothetical protein
MTTLPYFGSVSIEDLCSHKVEELTGEGNKHFYLYSDLLMLQVHSYSHCVSPRCFSIRLRDT